MKYVKRYVSATITNTTQKGPGTIIIIQKEKQPSESGKKIMECYNLNHGSVLILQGKKAH